MKPIKSKTSEKNSRAPRPASAKPIVDQPIFIKSAVWPEDYPQPTLPEIAIAGRSNAGKSSLLNAIWGLQGKSKLAKVSTTPGKTRLLNFFEKTAKYRIVDVPGYGFAARSESERKSWRTCVERYFTVRETLVGIILVMDIRRNWDAEETDLIGWLHPVPWLLVLTKSDKLSRSQILQRQKTVISSVREVRGANPAGVIVCSALSGQGADEVEMFVYKNWVRNAKKYSAPFEDPNG